MNFGLSMCSRSQRKPGSVGFFFFCLSSMMLFKRSFGLTGSLFILYVHEHDRLGLGMLSVETAVFDYKLLI